MSTVYWTTGTLDQNPHAIEIPVDSVTKRITFTFSTDTKGTKLALTQPSGGRITDGAANTGDHRIELRPDCDDSLSGSGKLARGGYRQR